MTHPHRPRPGGLLAAAGALALLAGCGAQPAARTSPSPRATASPSPTPAPSAAPSPSPTVPRAIPAGMQVTDVSFVSPTVGFALGENCLAAATCQAVIVTTADGGVTWSAAAAPAAAVGGAPVTTASGAAANGVAHLTFASPLDGWAWGPGLYATSDGAASWSRVATAGVVLSLAVVGGQVWAVEADCGGGTAGGACPLVLESAPQSGGSWSPVSGLPATDAVAASLTATTGADAWLEAVVPSASGGGTALLLDATTDGGTAWVARSVPCREAAPGVADPLGAYGASTLWLGCVSQPAAGNQAKAIYTSADGGASWSLASSTGPAAAGVPAAQGRIPTGGYLDQLALTGPATGWMALGRGTLLTSLDGGRTWTGAIPVNAVAAGSGVVRVSFAGGSGFAIADGVSLPGGTSASAVVYHATLSGGGWAPVPLG